MHKVRMRREGLVEVGHTVGRNESSLTLEGDFNHFSVLIWNQWQRSDIQNTWILYVYPLKENHEHILILYTHTESKTQQHKSTRGEGAGSLLMQDWGTEQVARNKRVWHWGVRQTHVGKLERPQHWLGWITCCRNRSLELEGIDGGSNLP